MTYRPCFWNFNFQFLLDLLDRFSFHGGESTVKRCQSDRSEKDLVNQNNFCDPQRSPTEIRRYWDKFIFDAIFSSIIQEYLWGKIEWLARKKNNFTEIYRPWKCLPYECQPLENDVGVDEAAVDKESSHLFKVDLFQSTLMAYQLLCQVGRWVEGAVRRHTS